MRVAGAHVGLTCENAFGGRNRDTRVTREPVVGPGLPWFDHGPCSGSVTVSPSGQTSQGRTSSCWPRSTSGTLATWTPAWLRRSATWFETQSGPASRPRLSGEKPQKDLCYQVRNRLRLIACNAISMASTEGVTDDQTIKQTIASAVRMAIKFPSYLKIRDLDDNATASRYHVGWEPSGYGATVARRRPAPIYRPSPAPRRRAARVVAVNRFEHTARPDVEQATQHS
jgi:hypothetical protein